MSENIKAWLLDIMAAIQEIDSFLPEERDFSFLKKISKHSVLSNVT